MALSNIDTGCLAAEIIRTSFVPDISTSNLVPVALLVANAPHMRRYFGQANAVFTSMTSIDLWQFLQSTAACLSPKLYGNPEFATHFSLMLFCSKLVETRNSTDTLISVENGYRLRSS